MTQIEELYLHAARCLGLASRCSDPTIVEKLRRLAQDYKDMAEERLSFSATKGGAVKSYHALSEAAPTNVDEHNGGTVGAGTGNERERRPGDRR
jgi:hypothetical protein